MAGILFNNHPGRDLETVLDWEARREVLDHFYSYRYFAHEKAGIISAIDILNLDTADVEYYNRTVHLTHGFKREDNLAQYLLDYTVPSHIARAGLITHRERLLHHVYKYNTKQSLRRRLLMVGMTKEDIAYLASLALPIPNESDSYSSPSCTSSVVSNDSGVSNSCSISSSMCEKPDAKMAWATDGVHCDDYIDGYDHLAEERETMKAISTCLASKKTDLQGLEVA